jgi:hypothetical protein
VMVDRFGGRPVFFISSITLKGPWLDCVQGEPS